MEFRYLKYFVEVVNEKSFTKAAEKLFLSQSALSKMIKKLEEEVGEELLNRKYKSFVLTDMGKRIYNKAYQIVEQYDEFSDFVSNISTDEHGSIDIGIPSVIGACLFSQIIPFQHEYPGIKLNILEAGARDICEKVADEKLGLGLTILPVDESRFDYFPVVEGEINLIVSEKNKLAKKNVINLIEVKNENFVLLNETFMLHHNIMSACKKAGFVPDISVESINWDFLISMVIENNAVTILPHEIISKFKITNVKEVKIAGDPLKWSIVFITKKNKLISYVTKKFIEFIQDNAYFENL